MIRKLARRYEKLYFGYEAGPTGYGLYRQVRALGKRDFRTLWMAAFRSTQPFGLPWRKVRKGA
jgi:hypothetical protein